MVRLLTHLDLFLDGLYTHDAVIVIDVMSLELVSKAGKIDDDYLISKSTYRPVFFHP